MKKTQKRSFGYDLLNSDKKTNNSPGAHAAKIQIRQNVLAAIGAEEARVLDCFAGAGEMYRGVWHAAASYVGCDKTWYRDDRKCYVADNLRLLRAIDLAPYNIFDLDSWGSPWEQVIILAARRRVAKGERIGIILTEGAAFRIRLGTIPTALSIMARMSLHAAGGSRSVNEISDRAIGEMCRRLAVNVVNHWRAIGTTGAQMIYTGLVLEGKG